MTPSFYRMPRGDLAYLVVVIAFAVVALLPWAREVSVGGMALVGWLMAALMVLSPAIALWRLWRLRRPRGVDPSEPPS